MEKAAGIGKYSDEVKSVLRDSAPVLLEMILEYGLPEMIFGFLCPQKDPLITKYVCSLSARSIFRPTPPYSFMDMTWQYNNPPNPADAKDGPQAYDDHLYYSFGVSVPVSKFSWYVAEFRHCRVLPIPIRRPT